MIYNKHIIISDRNKMVSAISTTRHTIQHSKSKFMYAKNNNNIRFTAAPNPKTSAGRELAGGFMTILSGIQLLNALSDDVAQNTMLAIGDSVFGLFYAFAACILLKSFSFRKHK